MTHPAEYLYLAQQLNLHAWNEPGALDICYRIWLEKQGAKSVSGNGLPYLTVPASSQDLNGFMTPKYAQRLFHSSYYLVMYLGNCPKKCPEN